MISFRSQAWLPSVMTSAPAANSARAMSGAKPKPCDAFSALTTARSIRRSWRRPGKRAATASLPLRPRTSPRKSILNSAPAANDAVLRRDGIQPNVVRANGHGVHLLRRECAAEAEPVRQSGQGPVVEAPAITQPPAHEIKSQEWDQQQ